MRICTGGKPFPLTKSLRRSSPCRMSTKHRSFFFSLSCPCVPTPGLTVSLMGNRLCIKRESTKNIFNKYLVVRLPLVLLHRRLLPLIWQRSEVKDFSRPYLLNKHLARKNNVTGQKTDKEALKTASILNKHFFGREACVFWRPGWGWWSIYKIGQVQWMTGMLSKKTAGTISSDIISWKSCANSVPKFQFCHCGDDVESFVQSQHSFLTTREVEDTWAGT